jgi:hypothetical protein
VLDPDVQDRNDLIKILVRKACDATDGVDPEAAIDAVLKREKASPPRFQGALQSPTPGCRGSSRPAPPWLAFAKESTTRPLTAGRFTSSFCSSLPPRRSPARRPVLYGEQQA